MTDEQIALTLSPGAREALDAIKAAYGIASDGEAIRVALGTERRMAEAFQRGEHIIVARSKDERCYHELVFPHWPRP